MELSEDYMDKLKAVFDLCDADQMGYISVQHFLALAKEHFGAEDEEAEGINGIVSLLDPTGDGRIHFGEFVQGVKQILELKTPTATPTSAMDGPGLSSRNIGSEETLVPKDEDSNSCGTHETSEVSTYNEYDMMTDDDNIQHISSSPSDHLGIPRTIVHSEDDRDSAISGRSMDYQDNRHSSGLYESNFEDYGQAEDASSESDPKENRPATLSIPSSRKITSSALASHLYRAGSSANASRRSSCSDDIYDDIDGNFTELNDKIKLLESQVILLSQSQLKNDEKQNKLKEDNALLIERVHMLEEQLREVEMRANQKIQEDKKRYRDNLAKTDNEKTLEIELLTTSLRHIEKEYQILKDEAPRLRVENEKLKRENTQLEQRLSDLQDKLHRLEDEHKDIQNRLQEEKGEMDLERQVNAQLLDELSKELDELRTYKLDTEGKGRTRSASIELPRSRRKEMEAQINVLKQNMKQLKDENEDLQAQVISSHVREGRNLVNGGTSLAQEIESLPRDELLKSLNETKDENRVLKDYIERMTLKILEKNPSILEMPITPIKTSKNKKK